MEFSEFKRIMQDHVTKMFNASDVLFITDVDKEEIWELYLNSFPEGTNLIFRERREHDCNCCKHFIRSFGNVVAITKDNKVVSIWDFTTGDEEYQPVIESLSKYVKSKPIKDVFITKEHYFGTDKSREQRENSVIHTWEHFYIKLPDKFREFSPKSEASITGVFRDLKNVFKRSLEEISKDSIESVLELISQKSLYKGEEWESVLTGFLKIHNSYSKLPEKEKDNFCWRESKNVGGVIGKIKNHSIGVLLQDITKGTDLNEAVRRYEAIVAPVNYKRPKAIFTKKMIEAAQSTIQELGLTDSLGRRFALIDDITINNIIFANRDTIKRMEGDVFLELKKEVSSNQSKKFDKVAEIPIETFIEDVIPKTSKIEVFFENNHEPNLVSLIAPKVVGSPTMFKWNNGFSWAYNGNITDSMKQRVKAAGGKIDGVLRFSIQWNENSDNTNDFDAHCEEPSGNHIYFARKKGHYSGGELDVDIIHPQKSQVAVENITWPQRSRMQEGLYKFYVHCYSYRSGRSGFRAEIEYGGQTYSYDYSKPVKQGEVIRVADLTFKRDTGIKFVKEYINSSMSSRTIWGLKTNEFHPVYVCMFSPNYWDAQSGIGHKHYFFMLQGCKNDTTPNGFFNEFLQENLMEHKRVFEALGDKMRVEPSDDQLSGLGFSSTQRNSLICKVEGNVSRIIKVIF